jgi:anti-anti-sigma factor
MVYCTSADCPGKSKKGRTMKTEVTQDTHVIVHAATEIDLSNIAEFVKALDKAAEMAPNAFIIDLSETIYIDSAGVQAIFAAYLKIDSEKGHLALIVGNERIKTVLEVVHLEVLPGMLIYDNLCTAREMFSANNDGVHNKP